MNKTKELWRQNFVSSSQETEQFKKFYRTFKREFTTFLENLGCTNLQFSKGHFESCVFFTAPNGQCWYFRIGDVRWFKDCYFRKVKDYRDFHGETNINCSMGNFESKLTDYLK